MGGTFDPIHVGHLLAASEAAHRLELDRVIFAPAGQPWHKGADPGATAEDRYLMTVLATSGDPRFDVTRVDVDRPGPTYTVDTLTQLRTEVPGPVDWYFITGADALAEFPSWHRPEEIVSMAHLVGVSRPGHVLQEPDLPRDRWTLLDIPAWPVSSTEIRHRVLMGAPIEYLVPRPVASFIAKRALYLACERL